jgi:phospholipid/cholesterol/gamma-HCH transport system substrate-binding protein
MPRETNLEFKVGVFVAVSVVCLVLFISSVSDFSFFRKGSAYTVHFYYANGLKKSAPVRLSGVDAGHVRDLKVFFDPLEQKTKVAVGVWLEEGMAIPQDSQVLINQLGILGEKYVEILPGTAADFAEPGAVLKGEDPVPMESITKKLSALGSKAEETFSGINNGILTNNNKQALEAALTHVAGATRQLDTEIMSEANKRSVALTLAHMAAVTGSLNSGEGTVGRFLKDPAVYQNLDEMTADLKVNPWKLFYRPKGQK